MERFDIRTAYPLMLHLLALQLDEASWHHLSRTLESYLLRRAVLGWSTKAYNRVFLTLVKNLRKQSPEAVPEAVEGALGALTGETSAWPTDEQFSRAWMNGAAYRELNRAKITHILARLSTTYQTNKTEELAIDSELTVEHVLPQNWLANWPLPDGSKGLEWRELIDAEPDDPRAVATRSRERSIHTFGNLTILTQALNSSVSNGPWVEKKPALLQASLLPINLQLGSFDRWEEEAIVRRGQTLLERALQIWPRPRVAKGGQA